MTRDRLVGPAVRKQSFPANSFKPCVTLVIGMFSPGKKNRYVWEKGLWKQSSVKALGVRSTLSVRRLLSRAERRDSLSECGAATPQSALAEVQGLFRTFSPQKGTGSCGAAPRHGRPPARGRGDSAAAGGRQRARRGSAAPAPPAERRVPGGACGRARARRALREQRAG